jgi:hypothetical protein
LRGWATGPTRAREKKRKGLWPGCLGAEGLLGWREKRKKEREREKGLPFSFKFSFQIHFSNIQTSIKQNPCIRIMMHKHLLFLNYFSDV